MITRKQERIGVYVCHCGTNISHTVDVEAVVEFAKTLSDVVIAREYKYMCSEPGQDLIRQDVREHELTRIVVSSCSPLMHEETFRNACEDAGLNRFFFQMSNIREQCSWVHSDKQKATEKAKRLIAAAVRRVHYHRSMEQREAPVNPNAMVIGAGIAGIEAALKIAEAGRKVYLVEKEPSIGGHMAKFDKTFPTLDCAACILTPKMVQIAQHPNIEMMTYSELEDFSGYIGNFKAKVRRKARFVDEKKCTGCGQCIERCPVQYKPIENDVPFDARGIAVCGHVEPGIKEICDRAIEHHKTQEAPLISILQDVNIDIGYLPEDALRYISQETSTQLATVYHVATFYKVFSLTPRGEHIIRVCMGTACQVRGSQRVLNAFEDRLQIKAGQTTKDKKFTLETVNCLGACAMGPVVMADGEYVPMEPKKVARFIRELADQPVVV